MTTPYIIACSSRQAADQAGHEASAALA
jgi:hypothetical protein